MKIVHNTYHSPDLPHFLMLAYVVHACASVTHIDVLVIADLDQLEIVAICVNQVETIHSE